MQVPWQGMFEYGAVVVDRSIIVLQGSHACAQLQANPGSSDAWRSDDLGQTWRCIPMACEARSCVVAGAVGGRVLLLCGWGQWGGPLRDVWKSDDRGDKWQRLRDGPFAPRAGAAVATIDESIFLLGGWSGQTNLNDVWRSDDRGETWQGLPNAPWPPRHTFAALGHRGSIFILGGWQNGWQGGRPLPDVWRLEDSGQTWSQLAAPPWGARRGLAAVSLGESCLLVLGGGGNIVQWARPAGDPACEPGAFADAWRSEDAGETWQPLPQPPWPARSEHRALAVGADLVLLLGGAGQGQEMLRDAWWYSGNAELWTESPPAAVFTLLDAVPSAASPDEVIKTFGTLAGQTFEIQESSGASLAETASRIRELRGVDHVQIVTPDGKMLEDEAL